MLSACELILEGKAKPGDTVDLLWGLPLCPLFLLRLALFRLRSSDDCCGGQERVMLFAAGQTKWVC